MKVPFDIKYRTAIVTGAFMVVTRDDRPVKIIGWDSPNGLQITGLIINSNHVECWFYDINGKCEEMEGFGNERDLFVLTEKEDLSLEQTWIFWRLRNC